MKRYHFSLEAVLRVRRAQEEAAGFALAHANQQRQRALTAHQEALARMPGPPSSSAARRITSRSSGNVTSSERRAAAVSIALEAVDAATDEATARLADWSAAAKLVAAVERLDDRRREEWRLEEQRARVGRHRRVGHRWMAGRHGGDGPAPCRPRGAGHDHGRRLHDGGPDAGYGRRAVRRSARPWSKPHRRAISPASWPTPTKLSPPPPIRRPRRHRRRPRREPP